MAVGVALAVLVLVLGGGQVAANDTQNLNRLLNNQVIVSRQIMCVLEKSPCDQLGRQLKGEFGGFLFPRKVLEKYAFELGNTGWKKEHQMQSAN